MGTTLSVKKKASCISSTFHSSRDRPLLFGIGITWPKGDIKHIFKKECKSFLKRGDIASTHLPLLERGKARREESEKMGALVFEVHDVSQKCTKRLQNWGVRRMGKGHTCKNMSFLSHRFSQSPHSLFVIFVCRPHKHLLLFFLPHPWTFQGDITIANVALVQTWVCPLCWVPVVL